MIYACRLLTLKWCSKSWAVPCPMNWYSAYVDWTWSSHGQRTCRFSWSGWGSRQILKQTNLKCTGLFQTCWRRPSCLNRMQRSGQYQSLGTLHVSNSLIWFVWLVFRPGVQTPQYLCFHQRYASKHYAEIWCCCPGCWYQRWGWRLGRDENWEIPGVCGQLNLEALCFALCMWDSTALIPFMPRLKHFLHKIHRALYKLPSTGFSHPEKLCWTANFHKIYTFPCGPAATWTTCICSESRLQTYHCFIGSTLVIAHYLIRQII